MNLGCSLPPWGGMLHVETTRKHLQALEERSKHFHKDKGEKQLTPSCAAMQSVQPLLSLQHWTTVLQY